MKYLLLFILVGTALAQYPTTPNLGLQLPPHATGPGWGIALNQNAVVLDSLFSNGPCGGDGIHAVILTGSPLKFGCSSVGAAGAVLLNPASDQTIAGSFQFINRGLNHVGVDLSSLSAYAQSALGALPNYIGQSFVFHAPGTSNVGFSVWDEGIFGTATYAASLGTGQREGFEGDAYTTSNGDIGIGVYGYAQVNQNSALDMYGHYAIVTSAATGFSPGGTVSGVAADYFADTTTVTLAGSGKSAAYYSRDQGSGANNYGIFFEGVTHNDLGGGVTKVGNLLDSGLSINSAVCTDGSKNLSTSGCAGGTPAFSALTSATNTTAAMLVGTGSSLGVSGSGTINSTTLLGTNWTAPGTIGGTTPGTGHFSALDATSGITAISDGVHAGINSVLGNTTVPSIPSNSFGFIGPNSASFTSYFFQMPSTAPTVGQIMTLGAPVSNVVPVTFASGWTILSVAAPASDTVTCPNNTSTSFATTVYTIPANTLIAGKIYRVTLGFTLLSSGSPPTFGLNLLIGGTTVYTTLATTPTASVGSRPISLEFLIQGTAAASGSAAVLTHPLPGFVISAGPTVTPFTVSTVTQPVNLATNGTLAINPQLFCGANTAGNSMTLQQILVESN